MKVILFYKKLIKNGGAEQLLLETYKQISKLHECEIVVFELNKKLFNLNKSIKIIKGNIGLFLYLIKQRKSIIIGSSGHINLFFVTFFQLKSFYYHIHQPSIFSYNEMDKYAFGKLKKLRKLFNDKKKYEEFCELKKNLSIKNKIFCNMHYILSKISFKWSIKTFVLSELAVREKKILYNIDSIILRGAINTTKQNLHGNNKKNEKFKIITISRLVYDKRLDLVIKSLNLLKDKNINYFIYGEGPEKNNLIKLVKKLKLENSVNILGYIDEKNKYKEIASSDLFVSIGAADFNLTTIESIYYKTPVLLSNDSYYEKIFELTKSVKYCNQNEIDVSNSIEYFVSNKNNDVDWESIQKYININLTWSKFSDSLNNLIK